MNHTLKMRSKIIYLIVFLAIATVIKADDGFSERVFVRTDKDCYVAGENILTKFIVTEGNFTPSIISKVGYLEISNAQRPFITIKLALENGIGTAKIKIPFDIPSGIYQLTAYTRFMRNEGYDAFFKKHIAIINPAVAAETDKVALVENKPSAVRQNKSNTISVSTDMKEYSSRSKVILSIEGLPDNIADLTISVIKNEELADLSAFSKPDEKIVLKSARKLKPPYEYLPEYEGHILTGTVMPDPENMSYNASLGFVGNDIYYTKGQKVDGKNEVRFYTKGVYGKQQVVMTLVSQFYNLIPYSMNLVSSFCDNIPENLPKLLIYNNQDAISERFISAQLDETINIDTLPAISQFENYYNITPSSTYDLDEYTRFSTLGETIFEFITFVRVSKINGERRIRVFTLESERYNRGNTLVLLDGAPIYDHEFVLNYNPYLIKTVNIYGGRFTFGGEVYESIVSFVSKEQNLPGFRLDSSAQMFDYECPELPAHFSSPDYSKENNLRIPDFRNTLYWEPFLNLPSEKSASRSFYTSDIKGSYLIKVEGFTQDGKMIFGQAELEVK